MNKKTAVALLAFFCIGVITPLCKRATAAKLMQHYDSMQDTIYMGNSAPNPSREVQIPNVQIPDVKIPGGENTFTPQPFTFDRPSSNYVHGPTTFNTDPKLYKLDKEVFGKENTSSLEVGHMSTETIILAGAIFIIGLLTGIIVLLLKRN